jgi:hypothetical protein
LGGIEQLAVRTEVVFAMENVGMVLVIVKSVWVVVMVTRLGVMVLVGETVVEGSVTVDCGNVVVAISVSTEVALTTGVDTTGTTTVGVYVVVCWAPTVSVKSRSYAIGAPLPLLLMIRIDHSPEYS